MSTYLLAFLVGDFKCINAMQDGVKLGVCATPDKMELTPFALNVAKFAAALLRQLFRHSFPSEEAGHDRDSRL